jgi:regulator of sigma E protease
MSMTILRGLEELPVSSLPEGVATRASTLPGVFGLEVVTAPEGSGLAPGDLLLESTQAPDSIAADDGEPGPATSLLSGLFGADTDADLVAVTAPEVIEITVTPYLDEVAGRGMTGISITRPMVLAQLSAPAALWHGVRTTALMTESMVSALAQMLRREMEADLRGPLGIAELSKQTMDRGVQTFLQFMAVLSINLAIINLLPIPALDGGRLLFIAAEAIRGRRMEPSREAVVHLIGFALVIGLMAMLTVFDGWRMLTAP